MTEVRKGQAPGQLSREEFGHRYRQSFVDPAFAGEADAISRLEEIAWDAYKAERKSPVTRKAGPGYADPDYDLSVDWIATRDAIQAAEASQRDPASPPRVLLVNGSPRNDGTCPGEISKTYRLRKWMTEELEARGMQVDSLDLSLLSSEYGRKIHPCKACVSTAMPLCHWPCSCYPNHSLGQTPDWMNEIYPRWSAAHAILIVTPTHWYHATSALKLMIDRLGPVHTNNVPAPAATRIRHRRTARSRTRPRGSKTRDGATRSIWPGASTASWFTGTSPASRVRVEA